MAKAAPSTPALAAYADMRGGIVAVLQAARVAVARNVNALMTASYWKIGHRIVEAEQKGQRRAGYGEQLVERLALDLTGQFGRGFSRQNLQQMRLFYLAALPTLSSSGGKPQTPSAVFEATSRPWALTELANAFPLPWLEKSRLLLEARHPAPHAP